MFSFLLRFLNSNSKKISADIRWRDIQYIDNVLDIRLLKRIPALQLYVELAMAHVGSICESFLSEALFLHQSQQCGIVEACHQMSSFRVVLLRNLNYRYHSTIVAICQQIFLSFRNFLLIYLYTYFIIESRRKVSTLATGKVATFADRLNELLRIKNITKTELAKKCDINRSNMTRYCRDEYEAKQDVVYRIANEMNVDPVWLIGYDVPMERSKWLEPLSTMGTELERKSSFDITDYLPPDIRFGANNITNIPAMRSVPLVGTIACGTPILAEQNIEGDVSAPEHVHADFALRCQGDSMINARIFDGDIVYIRQQETVDDGEIAAVLINDEATLKRVHLYEDHVVLEPENPQYRPLVYWGIDMNAVRILGKAVAFTSIVR